MKRKGEDIEVKPISEASMILLVKSRWWKFDFWEESGLGLTVGKERVI